jgi:membrane protein implicated in regulation of membrane protease activity
MKFNKRRASNIFLVLGIVFLAVGIATNNTAFSWAAVVFVVLSLLLGGRWLRPRRK